MKRWLYAALPALALMGQPVLANPHGPPPAEMIDEMTKDLGLDANQKQQVQKIFEEQHAKMEEERKLYDATGQRPTPEEMHAKHEQARQDLDSQLSTVLTLDQIEKLHKKMDEMRAERHHWHKQDDKDNGAPAGTQTPADKPSAPASQS